MVQVSDGFGGTDSITVNVTVSRPVLTLKSNAAMDGYVLETAESSTLGGAMNSAATTFNVGDDAANKQYRAILSFNTAPLPDNAVITSVTLKIRRQGSAGAANPFLTLGNIAVDIKKGNFAHRTCRPGLPDGSQQEQCARLHEYACEHLVFEGSGCRQLRLHQQGWEHPVPPALHEGR